MESLPIYIPTVLILCTLFAIGMLWKASHYSLVVIITAAAWLLIQAMLSLQGFYTITNTMPPRFALLIVPPVLLMLFLFLSPKGKQFIGTFDVKTLTLFHVVRIPVELTLYWLFIHKTIPRIMTFEGMNMDIFCGISAPFIYYFGYVKNSLHKNIIIAWNIICLLLLANIASIAILSAPFPIQRFGLEQPNIALLYFPYTWLPACIVAIALFAHLVALKSLLGKNAAFSNHNI